MHPLLGYLVFIAILYGFFTFVFQVGGLVERPVLSLFDRLASSLTTVLPEGTLAVALLNGLIQGVAGAIGLALPYLVPFLFGLALLEDVGYLPRVGYLLDGLMHRIGLHGKSIIPFILGYGCSVPAVMATRILESPRDRFVTAALAIMVPCVARTTVVFGLVGAFLGPLLAVVAYLVNLVVIALAGKVLTRLFPQVTPGLILEIPTYKVPSPRTVAAKVWLRVREFLLFAWPLLIGGSVILSLLEYMRVERYLNLGLLPITWPLGLPAALGVPLVFGVWRKELSLLMIFQALGTMDVRAALSPGQIMTFTLFLLFYVPCLATLAVFWREFGRRRTLLVVFGTTGLALLVGVLVRAFAALVR
jgi:ferrous iron transport protein B